MGKTIGIKLADGSFYPIIESGMEGSKKLDLTTVRDDQTEVHVDLFSANNHEMKNARYIGTLQLDRLASSSNGDIDISLNLSIDNEDTLSAEITEPISGNRNVKQIPQISKAKLTEVTPDYAIVQEEPITEEADEFAAAVGDLPDLNIDLSEILPPSDDADTEAEVQETVEEVAAVETKSEENAAPPETAEEKEEDALIEDELTFLDETIEEESADLPDDIDIDLSNLDFDLQDDEVIEDAENKELETEEIAAVSDDDFAFLDEPIEAESAAESVTDINELIEAEAQTEITVGRTLSDGEVNSLSNLFNEVKETSTEMKAETIDATDGHKHINAAVITCIICALLCIGALVVVCFLLPSKLQSGANSFIVTDGVEVLPEIVETLPPLVPHVEDVLVEPAAAEEAEPVAVEPPVPEPESVAKPATPEPVRYRIKWGDTLWNLAGSYYDNPWLFRQIALYNGIKNPAHIVSGTEIILPPK